MRPIVPAIAVFVLTQPAPEAPPAVRVANASDPGNPYDDATCNGIVQTAIEDGLGDGVTDLALNPWSGAYGSASPKAWGWRR